MSSPEAKDLAGPRGTGNDKKAPTSKHMAGTVKLCKSYSVHHTYSLGALTKTYLQMQIKLQRHLNTQKDGDANHGEGHQKQKKNFS